MPALARFLAVLLTVLLIDGAAAGQASRLKAFNGAVAAAYDNYRAALFYMRTGNPLVAGIELQDAKEAWRSEVMPFAAAPPDAFVDDPSFARVLAHSLERMSAAQAALEAGDVEDAAEALRPLREDLSALRARNGVIVFSDCVDAANAAMERLWRFRESPPALDDPEQVNALKKAAAVTEQRYRDCLAAAGPDLRESAEFRRLVEGPLESLPLIWQAADEGDLERVINILREVQSFDRMLWLRYG